MVEAWLKMCGAVAIAGSLPALATAQDLGPGGVQYQFSLAQGVSSESDFALASFGTRQAVYGATRLSFGISSETRTERIALQTGATVLLLPSYTRTGGADVAQPFVALSYARDAARSGLSMSIRHDREGLAFVDRFTGVIGAGGGLTPLSAPEDVEGGGTRATTGFAARMDTGRDTPVAWNFGIAVTRVDLFGATDPDLEERSGATADLGVTLAFAPNLQGRVRTEISVSEDRDLAASRSEEGRLVLGLTHQATQDVSFSVEAGPVWQRDRSFGLSTEDVGATGAVTVTLGRSDWDLTAALSGTEVGGDRSYSGALDWRASLDRGQLLARASYDIVPGDATEPDETTAFLGFGYLHELNPLAQLGLSIAASERETAGIADIDRSLALSTSYRHEIARDVALQAGYQFRRRDDGLGRQASSHGLFLELSFDTEGLF